VRTTKPDEASGSRLRAKCKVSCELDVADNMDVLAAHIRQAKRVI